MGRVYSVHEGEMFGLGNIRQNRLKNLLMTWLYFNFSVWFMKKMIII